MDPIDFRIPSYTTNPKMAQKGCDRDCSRDANSKMAHSFFPCAFWDFLTMAWLSHNKPPNCSILGEINGPFWGLYNVNYLCHSLLYYFSVCRLCAHMIIGIRILIQFEFRDGNTVWVCLMSITEHVILLMIGSAFEN